MIVSTRIKSYNKKKFKYQIKHDLRLNTPSYVDKSRINKNRYISFTKAKTKNDVISFVENEFEFIQKDFQEHNNRKLRSDTGMIIEGIITFSKDARNYVNDEQNWEEIDKRAISFVRELERKWNTKAVYIARHCDETTTHYHFAVMNYDYKNHKTIRASLKKRDTSQLQDSVAKSFEDLGFVRGKHLAQRIREGDDNTFNWGSVAQIHRRMLKEIDEMQKREKELQDKIEKYERLSLKKQKEIEELKGIEEKIREFRIKQIEENQKELLKAEKTYITYQNRIEKSKKELAELEMQKQEKEKLIKELKEKQKILTELDAEIEKKRQEKEALEEYIESVSQIIDEEIKQKVEEEQRRLKKMQSFLMSTFREQQESLRLKKELEEEIKIEEYQRQEEEKTTKRKFRRRL